MGHETELRIHPSKCGCCGKNVGRIVGTKGGVEFNCSCMLSFVSAGFTEAGTCIKATCVAHGKIDVITYINDGQEESPW